MVRRCENTSKKSIDQQTVCKTPICWSEYTTIAISIWFYVYFFIFIFINYFILFPWCLKTHNREIFMLGEGKELLVQSSNNNGLDRFEIWKKLGKQLNKW